jgi:signal transduction histidine kinase
LSRRKPALVVSVRGLVRAKGGAWTLLLDDRPGGPAGVEAAGQADQQLRPWEKMQSLGGLAGGIAHEFNNLLAVILGNAHLLADQASQASVRSAAREIAQAARRAASMTRQLNSTPQRQTRRLDVLDLNAMVSQMEGPLRRLIGEGIELVLEPVLPLAPVRADRGQIERVLLSLAANARDAMPQGGTLRIRTAGVAIDRTRQEGRAIPPGHYVSLSFIDTGCGMDAATRARAFEPFFTTRPPGRGAGLGLTIVKQIVEEMGGEILLESEPGQGTRVEVLLPGRVRAVSPKGAGTEEPAPRGRETVLVVEDDEQMRKLLCAVLERLGYTVVEAATPAEAVELARLHPPIDLLLTNLAMPGIDGTELAGLMRAIHSEIRVLYLSDAGESLAEGALPGSAILTKPFTLNLLANRVREVLDWPVHAGW